MIKQEILDIIDNIDHVKCDIKNGVYRSIDYGIAKRSL